MSKKLFLHNTLGNKKEEFVLKRKIGLKIEHIKKIPTTFILIVIGFGVFGI